MSGRPIASRVHLLSLHAWPLAAPMWRTWVATLSLPACIAPPAAARVATGTHVCCKCAVSVLQVRLPHVHH